jgi:uncharacterized protein (TIRG00374 family)
MNPGEPTEESSLKTWGVRLLKAGITVLALWLTWRLLKGIEWSVLEERLEEANWYYLVPGLILMTGRYVLWEARISAASWLAIGRRPKGGLAFWVLLASAALNLITPSARLIGGLMRARYLARGLARPFGQVYGVVLYDQVAHQAVMSGCTWLAVIVAAPGLGYAWLGVLAAAVLAALIVGLALWSRKSRSLMKNPLVLFLAKRAAKAEGRTQRLYAHGHEAVGVFVRLLGQKRLHGLAAVLGSCFFLTNILAQWCVFRSLDMDVAPLVILVGVALGNAAGMLTGTPGGLGTTEAAMVASFTAMGMDRVDAAAGTLLYRALHYLSILGLGVPALLVLELKPGEEQPGEEPEASG